jgi:2-oxoglutarate/2-oxoacid ferredoxin oxidoreductase subunit beta
MMADPSSLKMSPQNCMQLPDLTTQCNPNWCPGCGDLAIWGAFKNAAVQKDWNNSNTALVAGIGCHGHILNFVKLISFEGLHGRALPVASGIKFANHNLNVFVFSGDGDCLSEGGNHFVHACRRNMDLTLFIHDNAIYGLTTGQTSPTSPLGFKSKSTPNGSLDNPVNPLALAIAAGATFVARGYAGDIPGLAALMIRANAHKGMSVLDILQPCVTFNKAYSHTYYRDNTYQLDAGHDVTSKAAAFKKAQEWGPKQIPLGVFYEVDAPTYESRLPQLTDQSLVHHSPERKNLDELFKKFS